MTFEQWITGQRERGQVPFGTAYELFSRKAFDAGVAAERERCAVLVETRDVSGHDGYIETSGDLLDALAGCIRRGA